MALTRFAQDNVDLRSRFSTEFADANTSIRVIWESQPEDYGGTPFPPITGEYLRIVIRQLDTQQVSFGPPRRFRAIGSIFMYIQTEANKGTNRNEIIADLAGRAMAAITLGGVILRDPRYIQVGAAEGKGFRGTVIVRYQSTFDEDEIDESS